MKLRKERVNINLNFDFFDKSLALIKKLEEESIQKNLDIQYKVFLLIHIRNMKNERKELMNLSLNKKIKFQYEHQEHSLPRRVRYI